MPGWDGKGIGMVQVEAEKKSGGGDADAERAHFFQLVVEAAMLAGSTKISAGRNVLLTLLCWSRWVWFQRAWWITGNAVSPFRHLVALPAGWFRFAFVRERVIVETPCVFG